MPSMTLRRLVSATHLLHPRTLLRAVARTHELADTTRELQASVARLQIQNEQLLTLHRLDREQRDLVRATNLDAERIDAHVRRAVAAAPLSRDPFPHIVVEGWLPKDVYTAVVNAVPPAIFFADREVSRQRLMVPFPMAPAYSDHVWRFMANEIIDKSLSAALTQKFDGALREYMRGIAPNLPRDVDLPMHASDGRIMLRRPGYVITPHRDPKWGFVTGLVYLARPGDAEAYGTQLYRVANDEEAPTDKPFYVDESRCTLVRSVPFRPNTLLAFMNSAGAHGASIPADAQPANLERYVYQFRLGPDRQTIARLLSHMPEQARARWAGAKAARASYD